MYSFCIGIHHIFNIHSYPIHSFHITFPFSTIHFILKNTRFCQNTSPTRIAISFSADFLSTSYRLFFNTTRHIYKKVKRNTENEESEEAKEANTLRCILVLFD